MEEFLNKNILITGASGLIGSNLVDRLMQLGVAKLFVTGRNKRKLEETFPEYLENEAFCIIEHDASMPYPSVISDIDYIFHAAGPMERNIIMNYPVNVILPNVIGTMNTLEYLRRQEIETGKRGRAIIFSSVTVYNNPTGEDYVAIESETNFAQSLDSPTACYSESKRMSEVIAKSYVKQYGIDAVVARLSTVYGPTKNVPDTAFYEFMKKSVKGEDVVVESNAVPRRDNIYISDAIDGLLSVAIAGETSESYNISSNGELGNYAAVDEIALLSSRKASRGSSVLYKEILGLSKSGIKLDNTKLKALGWRLHVSMDKGIERTVRSFLTKN